MKAATETLFADACRPDAMNGVCRQRGGESCAFDGAMIVLGCIADAAHLVHGPIACLGNSWESRGTHTTKGELHRRAYTTDLGELDIVYGAAEKLRKAIRETAADSRPRAIFVYATCVAGMIGEDIHAACREAEAELGLPVIPVDAPLVDAWLRYTADETLPFPSYAAVPLAGNDGAGHGAIHEQCSVC